MTQSHNEVRANHHLKPVKWSAELATYAQQQANYQATQNNCRMRHRPHSGKYKQIHGENIYWASPVMWSNGSKEVQTVTPADIVSSWAGEEKDYSYTNNTCQPGEQCGHYTQIVWEATTEVGCGMVICSDKGQMWVCNYDPPGNWVGEKPY